MSWLAELLTASRETFQHLGWLGVLAYAGAFAVLQMIPVLPASPLGLAAGAFFGFRGGIVAVTLGTNLGAAINFLLARTIARKALARRIERHEKFRLIDAAIGREGWKIIALLRFCPMPFGLANYCYGLTAIGYWPYAFATFFAILPANCFFVWLGSTAQQSLAAATGAEHPRHPGEYVFLALGLVAAFGALTYIAKIAKAAVAKAEPAAALD